MCVCVRARLALTCGARAGRLAREELVVDVAMRDRVVAEADAEAARVRDNIRGADRAAELLAQVGRCCCAPQKSIRISSTSSTTTTSSSGSNKTGSISMRSSTTAATTASSSSSL